MRRITLTALAAAAGWSWLALPAAADVKISVKTKSYAISGKTGTELLAAMDRRGPKHGFLTRAIAQTSYGVSWEIDWVVKNNTCRVRSSEAKLTVTYTYPEVSGAMTADMAKRWARFFKGVKKHEEMHGTLARRMVAAADKAVTGFSVKNDPSCRKAQAAVKKRVGAIYADYEAKQFHFDDVEHRQGGSVEALVRALKRQN